MRDEIELMIRRGVADKLVADALVRALTSAYWAGVADGEEGAQEPEHETADADVEALIGILGGKQPDAVQAAFRGLAVAYHEHGRADVARSRTHLHVAIGRYLRARGVL